MTDGRPTIWRAVMEVQWKWTRALAVFGLLIGFALPLLSLRMAAQEETLTGFVGMMARWGVAYAVIAAALGLTTAIVSWTFDHRLRHVYALTLPIPRWRYVLLRFAAGVLILAIPIAGVFAGAMIVAASALVPKELHAYRLALTLHFGFATLVAFAVFFAISAATPKTAGLILGGIALVIVADILLGAAHVNVEVVTQALNLVFSTPGLLAVFGGRWTLVDV